MGWCAVAGLHAARDLERGGECECIHCSGECDCDGDFDADELGLDPEEEWDYDATA